MEDDYYSTVYSWFDKCGIISNIRTHIRQNLVTALKNKDLAQSFGCNAPKSAKQYVYDLLIAEYLWNHNYVYTLSVFASEAPLLVNFNKHIKSSNNENNTQQKLQSDYVSHTLETLGIEPTQAKGQGIMKDYAENDVPLLLCILQYFRKVDNIMCSTSEERFEFVSKNVKHQGVQSEETGETIYREMSRVALAKKKLIHQKDLFDAQLKQKEIELKEQTVVLEKKLLLLQTKLEQAQKLMSMYNKKEKKLSEERKKEELKILEKETELNTKEKLLSQEAQRLEKERDSYRHFEGNLKKLQHELTKVRREIPQTERNYNLTVKDAQIQTDFESFTLVRDERNFLSQEKQDLNGLIKEQQSRIEQLTTKVILLSRKLEETQLKYSRNIDLPRSIIKVVNTNTVLSENSSAEDLIQETRMRLRRLEEESTKEKQCYTSFITNFSQ